MQVHTGGLFGPSLPGHADAVKTTVLKKGFDINLAGAAKEELQAATVKTFALQPPNFRGIKPIPKMVVEIGASVKAGDPLFYDKEHPDILFVAPVSGEVIAVNRGDKRAISEVVILADKEQQYRKFAVPSLSGTSQQDLHKFLQQSGAWVLFRQRPYDIIPEVGVMPRDIFVSTFDTAPLAPNLDFVVRGRESAFERGIEVLSKLTTGKVYLGLDARQKEQPPAAFTKAKGSEARWFHGKHPAGNVGVQIHHIKPIGAKDKVWTIGVQEVITLGTLFGEGRWDTTRVVALGGSELSAPHYAKTNTGANIGDLLGADASKEGVRFISGDVLTGQQKSPGNYLNFHDDQITAIKEGDYYEMFGWLIPGKRRASLSKTYSNYLFPARQYVADTNTHGEPRAFVVTGQYEDVLPMRIYPQHLLKAILAKDLELMEGLGIYEVIEEDLALCEFVCTSKQQVQKILRGGLDEMHAQG